MTEIPTTQWAVQLVGPSEIKLNKSKEVFTPGPTQILAKVEAVGLCFSDLKLLKQFDKHVRKGPVLEGLSQDVLAEIPSYVPNEQPTVFGHEVCARVLVVGEDVKHHAVGDRIMVQADWRGLKTAQSNGAFGYDFEGALQEYCLLDERVVMEPETGRRYLIPVSEASSASAMALVEPWACVEDSYVAAERRTIKSGGRLAVVVEAGVEASDVEAAFSPDGPPTQTVRVAAAEAAGLAEDSFDDIVYFGANAETVEALGPKLAKCGVFNIVTAGAKFSRSAKIDVGRVHYGATRWCGTTGAEAADGYAHIPSTGEIRNGDSVKVVGAGGPMGQMHVIRNLCTGKANLSLIGTDFDDARLEALAALAKPLAEANGVKFQLLNPQTTPVDGQFSYIALMAPVAALVAQAVTESSDGCIVNIFAGIPAGTLQEIDLDTYLANHCWLLGTSGSTIQDMEIVRDKVTGGQLDTNCIMSAVCGMAGAMDGLAAVENRTVGGKIVVYPQLREMGLIPLDKLAEHYPAVAEKLNNGLWTQAAEAQLLQDAK